MNKEYYVDLIDRIYNVLYTYENRPDSFNSYVKALTFELGGNTDFVKIQKIKYNLQALLSNDITHDDVRTIVLRSNGIISRILKSWEE